MGDRNGNGQVPSVSPDIELGADVVFRDKREEEIYLGLREVVGESPAAFFRDACRQINAIPPFDAATHTAAHASREIEGHVKDILEPMAARKGRKNSFWGRVRGYALRRGVKKNSRWIKALEVLDEDNQSHRQIVEAILFWMGIDKNDEFARAWLSFTGKGSFSSLAHRRGLGSPRPLDETFLEKWDLFNLLLLRLIDELRDRFSVFVLKARELAGIDKPTKADILTFVQEIPGSPVILGEFFKTIGPNWLPGLRKRGVFVVPSPTQIDDGGGRVRYEPWPQSKCLLRLASEYPNQPEVESIIESIAAADTDNPHIQNDLVRTACLIEPAKSVQVIQRAREWARGPLAETAPDSIADLMVHLAKNGGLDEAFALGRVLLSFESGGEPLDDDSDLEFGGRRLEPRSRVHDWQYGSIIKESIPGLATEAPLKTVEFLADLVADTLTHSRIVEEEDFEDYSITWRPEIPGNGPDHQTGPKNDLVSAIYSTAREVLAVDPSLLSALVTMLESKRWTILRRLALQLLAEHPTRAVDLAAERVCDSQLLNDSFIRNEMYALVQESFPVLPDHDKERFVRTVMAGPLEPEERLTTEGNEVEWKASWLSAARGSLPPQAEHDLDRLEEELGFQIGPLKPAVAMASYIGPTSPLGFEEVMALPPDALVANLHEWQPSGRWDGETREGLSRILADVTKDRAAELAAEARAFKDLDPTYIRGLLGGLAKAAEHDAQLDWDAILDLCRWVIDQPREIEGRDERSWRDSDPHWGWARKEVARLLLNGLQPEHGEEKPEKIDIRFRPRVWAIIEVLAEDSDPITGEEIAARGEKVDGALSAINTVRGEALRAAVRYGLWIRRHQQKEENAEELIARGFDEIPELRWVLNRHLNPALDDALGPRAVYGMMFPWLHLLDPAWANDEATRIFQKPEDSDLPAAAWGAYIRHCPPYDVVFNTLADAYQTAVMKLAETTREELHLGEPSYSLIEHLLHLFWRGTINLKDGGLLDLFFENASIAARKEFMSLVGRHAELRGRRAEPLNDEERSRLINLWEAQLETLDGHPMADCAELIPIGEWFLSGQIDQAWCIAMMKKTLDLAGSIDPDYPVLEGLANIANQNPLDAIQIAEGMVKGSADPWFVTQSHRQLFQIIKEVLESDDSQAVEKAKALANFLVSKGNLQFADLVSTETDDDGEKEE